MKYYYCSKLYKIMNMSQKKKKKKKNKNVKKLQKKNHRV